MSARFGPAGNSESFRAQGYKHTLQVPEYLQNFGLGAFEYQCGRGVRIQQSVARELGENARERDIKLSLHAPYYISLSSVDEQKRENSIGYILQSAAAVKAMGGNRIVVHAGSCGKMTREQALLLASQTLQKAYKALDEAGFSDVHICPETMGKVGQLGDLHEVLVLCSIDERLIPCIDFGHLYARTFGGYNTFEAVGEIFSQMQNKLGSERMRRFHAHFSKIAYTPKGGEKHHLTFADTEFGPQFEHVIEWVLRKNASPTIICESAGTQAEDAQTMMQYYQKVKGETG